TERDDRAKLCRRGRAARASLLPVEGKGKGPRASADDGRSAKHQEDCQPPNQSRLGGWEAFLIQVLIRRCAGFVLKKKCGESSEGLSPHSQKPPVDGRFLLPSDESFQLILDGL